MAKAVRVPADSVVITVQPRWREPEHTITMYKDEALSLHRVLGDVLGVSVAAECGHQWVEGVDTHVCDRIPNHRRTTHLCHCGKMTPSISEVRTIAEASQQADGTDWHVEAVLSSGQLDAITQRDRIKDLLLDAYEDLVSIMIDQHYRMTEIELRAQALWSRRRNL